ncbi:hypothetical protein KCU83_g7183, partial [Aureobasidium melanogenum]
MSSPTTSTSSSSIQLVEEVDTNGLMRLYCKPSTTPTQQETFTTHKNKHFTEIRIEGVAIDTIHLDEFLSIQTTELKKINLVNTHMHFHSTRDDTGEPCAFLTKIVYSLQHTLEVKSMEVKDLVCDYGDNISPSIITYAGKWEGVNEVRDGVSELIAKIKERGNRGLMKGQELVKPQSSFVEMERWEDEYGFASDGEDSDDDDYEHSEDEEWAM